MARTPHGSYGAIGPRSRGPARKLRTGQTRREAGTPSQALAHSSHQIARLAEWVATTKFEVHGTVKANLARFSYALVVLATIALSLGAGKRWL